MARGGEMSQFRFMSEQHLNYIQRCIDCLDHCPVRSVFVPVEESDVLAFGTSAQSEPVCVSFTRSEVEDAMRVQGDLRLGEHLRRLGSHTAEKIDQIVLSGSSDSLLRNQSASRTSAPLPWSDRAPGEVLAEVSHFISGSETDRSQIADTLLTSPERYQFLARTSGPAGRRPLLELLKGSNEWTSSTGKELRIFGLPELAPEALRGTQRLVAYRCEADVLRMRMRPLRFGSPQLVGARYCVPVDVEVGRLEIRRPGLVRYLVDI